jgi:succinate-semialdehyde dehydrogenase/glutarate-semialdehyde dehydrogenase
VSLVADELSRASLIGGREVEGDGWIEVVDPSDETPFARVAAATVADCEAAVDAAADALVAWRRTAPRERSELLRAAFELMRERAEQLAELIVRENGKALTDARGEVAYAAEFLRWYAEEAVRLGGEAGLAPAGDKRILVTREPIGVALLVTPWNFPAAMATRKLAPALAAGCTAVLKPSSETPLTVYAVADLLAEVGVPAGVVNVVTPRPTGPGVSAMIERGATRAISFTGSIAVGGALIEQAAARVQVCSMELGGNAPFVVFADADVEAAVEAALVAKMRNGGASCIAVNRIYVEEPIREEFTAAFTARMEEFVLGPGLEDATTLGPLVSARERDRVAASVRAAVGRGARVRCGGEAPDREGFYYPATVLEVAADDPILGEEIFGPVAPIAGFADFEEAVALANDTDAGLAAYVHAGDLALALRAAEALEAGMVGVNRGFISDPAAPFGGVKASGLGREGGHDGVEEFLEKKYIAVDWREGR